MNERPKKRADCENGIRPCPWLTCRYNIAADRLHKDIHNPKMSEDQVAAKLVRLVGPSCALDVAEEGGTRPIDIGRLMGTSSSRIKQIEAGTHGRVEMRFAEMGRRFKEEDKRTTPERVARVGFSEHVKKGAVAVLKDKGRGEAIRYVERETGRRVRPSQLRKWAKRMERQAGQTDPWEKLYKPRVIIRAALALYREKRAAGVTQRAAAEEISEELQTKVSWASLDRWEKYAKEHGEP